jgi:hypothetical protein
MPRGGSGNLHDCVAQAGLLKLKKNGQFPYRGVLIIVGVVLSNFVRCCSPTLMSDVEVQYQRHRPHRIL